MLLRLRTSLCEVPNEPSGVADRIVSEIGLFWFVDGLPHDPCLALVPKE